METEKRTRKPARGGLPYVSREGMTLEQCGEVMGLTRERIRQIEANALRKLARWCRNNGISIDDLRS